MPRQQLLIRPFWRPGRLPWPHFQPSAHRALLFAVREQSVSIGWRHECAQGFPLRPRGQTCAEDAVSCPWP